MKKALTFLLTLILSAAALLLSSGVTGQEGAAAPRHQEATADGTA